VHGGYLGLDRNISIDAHLIYQIIGFPMEVFVSTKDILVVEFVYVVDSVFNRLLSCH